jgi:hypothetical protein
MRRKDNINHQIFTGKNTREFGEIKGSGRAGIFDAQQSSFCNFK